MASINPESDISAFVNPIFEGALLVAREQSIMTTLVRNFNDRTGLAVRQNVQYGGATMNVIAETDDLAGQAFTPAAIATVTPQEIGAQYFLTDSRMESDPFTVKSDAAQDLGLAAATQIDTNLVSQLGTFTGGTVGTAGSLITWAHVFAAEAQLKAQFAPYPYMCVMHPFQWHQLAKAASVASAARTNAPDSLMESVNSMFFVKQAGGVFIYTSANIVATATGFAGLFSRDALAYDLRRAPRLEAERDASRRGYELNLSAVYGFGYWRPKFGITMVFDATKPTS
jgi:hypothetical protein